MPVRTRRAIRAGRVCLVLSAAAACAQDPGTEDRGPGTDRKRAAGHREESIPISLTGDGVHHAELRDLGNGEYEIVTKGGDPYVMSGRLGRSFDPDRLRVVAFEYLCPSGLDSFQVFFGPPITEDRSARGRAPVPGRAWLPYAVDLEVAGERWKRPCRLFRFDFGGRPGVTLRIRNIRLRSATPGEVEEARLRERRRLAQERLERELGAYLDRRFPARITGAAVRGERIRIEGRAPYGYGEIHLGEIPMHADAGGYDTYDSTEAVKVTGGRFSLSVDRYVLRDGVRRDRLFSRWVIAERTSASSAALRGGRLRRISALRYASEVESEWDPEEVRPQSRKGLGGVAYRAGMMNDLVELGVHNVTVNVVLNALISLEPSEGTMPHELNGKEYHFHRAAVERHDRIMRFAAENGIVVSAIILVTPEKSPERRKIFTHPDYDPAGRYTMANVTSREGVEHYAAALDFLARRYSRPDGRYGRITHWIMHNEVDAGRVWTNAGEKGLLAYMDLYHRSMRTAYYAARRYNPRAKVFISLTHHWNRAGGKRFYRPSEMLELLVRLCRIEGDFEWGVAYHPYPQDLRDPRVWEDTDVSFDLRTPLITFKNIEVLDAWARRREHRYLGREPRTILLSEQGLNSPDYGEESLALQAAGLVYAWHKIKRLKSVEAFHYHRWIDHELEGGLLLGLWTVREGSVNAAGRRKPAWHVYRDLGTVREQEASGFAEKITGQRLSRMPYTGSIGD